MRNSFKIRLSAVIAVLFLGLALPGVGGTRGFTAAAAPVSFPATTATSASVGDIPDESPGADSEAYGISDPPAPAPRPDAAVMERDLSSPRATVLTTFFPAINRVNRAESDLEEAWSHVLATMQWEQAGWDQRQARHGAVRLLEVFDKLGRLEPYHLPSEEDLRGSGIRRFIFFPQPDHHAWVWRELRNFDRWPVGEIVLVETEAGWRFSVQTLHDIEDLAASMSPLPRRHVAPQLYEPVEPDVAQQFITALGPTFEQTPYWGWIALFVGILLGLAAGKLASSLLRRTAARLDRRGWTARALILQDAANPLSLSLFALGLGLGFEAIALGDDLQTLRDQVLTFLYLFALGWFLFNLVNIIEVGLRRFTDRGQHRLDDIVVTLIRRALRIFLVVMFTLVVAENVFGLNVTAWIAGFGIVGLGISLAAQDSIRNLFGSITVFLDKPFKVGDFIELDSQRGSVESIGFRSTRLRLLTGHVLTVPNARFIDSNVENITVRPSIRRVMNVSVTYDTPTDKLDEAVRIVKDVLHDERIVAEGRFDMEDWPPRVAFDEMRSDNLNITAFYWYQLDKDPDRGWFSYMDHCQMVNMRIVEKFRAAGIDFAFPTQTLYLAGDDNRQLSVRMLQVQPDGDGQFAGGKTQ